MKAGAYIVFLILTQFALAQKKWTNYNSIDQYVLNIDASSPEELARELIAPYHTYLEKTRAIFSWIAQHISYDYPRINPYKKKNTGNLISETNIDTSKTLRSVNELVAEDVLKKRNAFCYGYSRLFKCLCDDANIPCEIINGYGRGDIHQVGTNFRTNHSWNAVKLDSSWYLVDVTWASGYFTYNSNQFIKHFDDQYFLTPPEQFALDHFPDDLKWSLLQRPPTIGEFLHSPYKSRCFVKYNITSYWPKQGVIQASIGDTINLRIETALTVKEILAEVLLTVIWILHRSPRRCIVSH